MKSLVFLFFVLNFNCYSQTFAYEKERHKFNHSLIEQNVINKIFKKSFDKVYEYEAKYLGKFKSSNEQFYIVNSSYVHLKNLRSDNQIFIYNSKKKFVGYYVLTTNYQLPTKLKNNILYFKIDNCIRKADLSKGIPKNICVQCEGKAADCFEFEKVELK